MAEITGDDPMTPAEIEQVLVEVAAQRDRFKRERDELREKLDEYEGKMQSGYSFCHPCDDCDGLRAASRLAAQRDELLQAIREHEKLWEDQRPVRSPLLEAVYKQDLALYEAAKRIEATR